MANDNNKIQATTDDSQIVLYRPDESIKLEVKLEHDTVWLNRQQMAQLFGRDIKTIGKHINNALHEELAPVQQAQILRQLKIVKIQLSQNLR